MSVIFLQFVPTGSIGGSKTLETPVSGGILVQQLKGVAMPIGSEMQDELCLRALAMQVRLAKSNKQGSIGNRMALLGSEQFRVATMLAYVHTLRTLVVTAFLDCDAEEQAVKVKSALPSLASTTKALATSVRAYATQLFPSNPRLRSDVPQYMAFGLSFMVWSCLVLVSPSGLVLPNSKEASRSASRATEGLALVPTDSPEVSTAVLRHIYTLMCGSMPVDPVPSAAPTGFWRLQVSLGTQSLLSKHGGRLPGGRKFPLLELSGDGHPALSAEGVEKTVEELRHRTEDATTLTCQGRDGVPKRSPAVPKGNAPAGVELQSAGTSSVKPREKSDSILRRHRRASLAAREGSQGAIGDEDVALPIRPPTMRDALMHLQEMQLAKAQRKRASGAVPGRNAGSPQGKTAESLLSPATRLMMDSLGPAQDLMRVDLRKIEAAKQGRQLGSIWRRQLHEGCDRAEDVLGFREAARRSHRRNRGSLGKVGAAIAGSPLAMASVGGAVEGKVSQSISRGASAFSGGARHTAAKAASGRGRITQSLAGTVRNARAKRRAIRATQTPLISTDMGAGGSVAFTVHGQREQACGKAQPTVASNGYGDRQQHSKERSCSSSPIGVDAFMTGLDSPQADEVERNAGQCYMDRSGGEGQPKGMVSSPPAIDGFVDESVAFSSRTFQEGLQESGTNDELGASSSSHRVAVRDRRASQLRLDAGSILAGCAADSQSHVSPVGSGASVPLLFRPVRLPIRLTSVSNIGCGGAPAKPRQTVDEIRAARIQRRLLLTDEVTGLVQGGVSLEQAAEQVLTRREAQKKARSRQLRVVAKRGRSDDAVACVDVLASDGSSSEWQSVSRNYGVSGTSAGLPLGSGASKSLVRGESVLSAASLGRLREDAIDGGRGQLSVLDEAVFEREEEDIKGLLRRFDSEDRQVVNRKPPNEHAAEGPQSTRNLGQAESAGALGDLAPGGESKLHSRVREALDGSGHARSASLAAVREVRAQSKATRQRVLSAKEELLRDRLRLAEVVAVRREEARTEKLRRAEHVKRMVSQIRMGTSS